MKRNKAYEFAMVLIDNLYNHHHARTVLVSYIIDFTVVTSVMQTRSIDPKSCLCGQHELICCKIDLVFLELNAAGF